MNISNQCIIVLKISYGNIYILIFHVHLLRDYSMAAKSKSVWLWKTFLYNSRPKINVIIKATTW